ncbi:Cytochrome c oxidase assembly protein COX19 [Camellia lanceoleosa]|uniref:Cytochrome c oxidase assembly protein COX19 n=1 Tax=Camellia lanceoleosa TaxID=1840588 RepID=A0ACC0I190_9ERIC|nr:Cytochrome c oxidase assembly protein COX19 [Camellia lanceoleosa]
MSAGGAFGGNRGVRPVPPEKGVFPLDHMHLCDLEKKEYINCLKSGGHKSEKCKHFSKKYLECRMEKNLMAKQDMSELGFEKGGSNGSEIDCLEDTSKVTVLGVGTSVGGAGGCGEYGGGGWAKGNGGSGRQGRVVFRWRWTVTVDGDGSGKSC